MRMAAMPITRSGTRKKTVASAKPQRKQATRIAIDSSTAGPLPESTDRIREASREDSPLSFGAVPRARVLLALAVAPLLACGGGPSPSLEDYTFGASKTVAALAPLFAGGRFDLAILARADAAGPLESLAATWRREADGHAPELRIADFQRDRSHRALVTLQVRLRGTSRADPGERLATARLFLLKLVRESSGAPWRPGATTALDTAPAAPP